MMNEKMHEGMEPGKMEKSEKAMGKGYEKKESAKHMKAMALKAKKKKKAKNPMDESKKHEAMKGDMKEDKGEYK